MRRIIRLAPILLNEMKRSVSCLISIIYDMSEEEKTAKPNDLNETNLTGEELINKSLLGNVSREI
jgi:hypothetical protein